MFVRSIGVLGIIGIAALAMSGCIAEPSGLRLATSGQTVAAGETVQGDLIALSGSVTVEQGGRVDGDVVLLSGRLRIDGRVDGDVRAASGSVIVSPTARVSGDVVGLTGRVRVSPDADVGGSVTERAAVASGSAAASAVQDQLKDFRMPRLDLGAGSRTGWAGGLLLRSVVPAILSMVVLALVPDAVSRTARTLRTKPGAAAAFGVGFLAIAATVLVILVLTICGIPFALIGALGVGILALLGLTALGHEVGDLVARALDVEIGPLPTVLIGTWLSAIGLGLLESVACCGWLLSIAAHATLLGAAALTLLGGRATGTHVET